MADNVRASAGTNDGATFATDDIGGVHHTLVKLEWGADGTANQASATTPVPVQLIGVATDGLDAFKCTDDLDETEEEVKGTAGTVYGVIFTNTATTTRWLKFYNATAANVTVGTTTPLFKVGLPGNASDDVTGVLTWPQGIKFSTAITVAVTTGYADNDTAAPSANDVPGLTVLYR